MDTSDVKVTIINETPKAMRLCIQEGENKGSIEWFPRSEVVMVRRRRAGQVSVANIPDWLLEKKGW